MPWGCSGAVLCGPRERVILLRAMKRTAFAIVCVSLVLVLADCNVWNIIWQGIIGKGYYQLTQSSIVNSSSYMTASPIDLTTLTTSSVIIYKTSASGLYG